MVRENAPAPEGVNFPGEEQIDHLAGEVDLPVAAFNAAMIGIQTGADAYQKYKAWVKAHPGKNLLDYMATLGHPKQAYYDPKAHKIYYGPVYFRHNSQPYMTIAMAGVRRDDGVSVAEVNLKFIWDVVSQIRVGERGQAYVVDAMGRLIAHPDLSLVLRNIDVSGLAQVKAARAAALTGTPQPDHEQVAQNLEGSRVLTAHARIPSLDWMVFV